MLMGKKMKKSTFRPRDLLNKEVAGIYGAARLTDKARAAHAGNIGSYKYGVDSEQDTAILSFLGISAEVFQEVAVRIDNDVKLGAWVLDHCGKSDKDISVFNRKLSCPKGGFLVTFISHFFTTARCHSNCVAQRVGGICCQRDRTCYWTPDVCYFGGALYRV
jgi:hypothetical protein